MKFIACNHCIGHNCGGIQILMSVLYRFEKIAATCGINLRFGVYNYFVNCTRNHKYNSLEELCLVHVLNNPKVRTLWV